MAAPLTTACRACNSPRREAIDARLRAGESNRAVARWLEAEGEPITHQGIANHRTNHLGVPAFGPPPPDPAKIIADAAVLDEVAAIALRTARALEPVVSGEEKPSMAQVVAFTGALSQARQAVTDRRAMLEGPVPTEVTVVVPGSPAWTDLQREVFGVTRQGMVDGGRESSAGSVAPGELPAVPAPVDPR